MAHNCSAKTKKSAGRRPCININDRLVFMLSPSRSARWESADFMPDWPETMADNTPVGEAVRAGHSQFAVGQGREFGATQCRSNPVSGRGLPKTGIFQISAGDYRRFRSRSGQFGSPETDSQFPKARYWWAFLRLRRVKSPGAGLPGWRRSADRTSLQGNSLVSGNFTGNFAILGPKDTM
jgi:hypothetical protein